MDLRHNIVTIDKRFFRLDLSETKNELFDCGGMASAIRNFGNKLFKAIMTSTAISREKESCLTNLREERQW